MVHLYSCKHVLKRCGFEKIVIVAKRVDLQSSHHKKEKILSGDGY